MNRLPHKNVARSVSFLLGAIGASSRPAKPPMATPVRAYAPQNPDGPFPYSKTDLTPMDPGNDSSFYNVPRFVTHIDDNAINSLQGYYKDELPAKGRILDLCSSWISHYPSEIVDAVKNGQLDVLGTGMNEQELRRNSILKAWTVQNLNEDPNIKLPGDSDGLLDASTCVVSIDYLTSPVEVLTSLKSRTRQGGRVHLVISNRCFPTKAVKRWLQIEETARLEMVGDYLHWAGWRHVEIVTVVEPGSWTKDPLWVVRGVNE